MRRFFFAHGISTHKEVFEYARGRFIEIYEGDEGVGRKNNAPYFCEQLDAEFIDYMDKLVYHACEGRPSDIVALEGVKTYIEFLSILNNHLEKVARINAQNDHINRQNS